MALESQFFNRSLGSLPQLTFRDHFTRTLINRFSPAPDILFDGSAQPTARNDTTVWAHRSGANAIAIDSIEGRFLITGGADSSIHLWDLNSPPSVYPRAASCRPILSAPKGKHAHTHGITCLSFYPFDTEAILSSSYDHTLKISSTQTLSATASFSLGSVINAHDMSPIAQHVMVACATQSSIVRLVDLKSGASAQGLIGHNGEVLNVAWSPKREYILASAGADGTVRLWDIRRSAAAVGMLDFEDEIGIIARGGERRYGHAHIGPCNAVAWTPDGEHIITAGHDGRIRVWEASTGRNTLVHFGPSIRNKSLKAITPVICNSDGRDILLWPNEKEILISDSIQGKILRRLRPRGAVVAQGGTGTRTIKDRVNGLVWRGAGHLEIYSAHADGMIRAWLPERNLEMEESDDVLRDEDDEQTKKRKALEELHRDMTRQKITFT